MTAVEVLVRYRDTCIEMLARRGIEYDGYEDLREHLSDKVTFQKYRKARSEFAEQNLGLVYVLVQRQFGLYVQKFGQEDLVHEGLFGVLRAIDKYQPKVASFSTYAMWWIRHHVQRAIENRLRAVRIPTWQITKVSRIRRMPEEERTPEDQKYLDDILPKMACAVPGPEMFERQPVSYDMDNIQDLKRVREVVKAVLGPRECEIIQKRFGFDGPMQTLQEIGDTLGISRERVRQVEEKALETLRKALE